MLDLTIIESKGAVAELRRIADALERLSPPPLEKAQPRAPRPVSDLQVTTDEHLADLEDEDARKQALQEEE